MFKAEEKYNNLTQHDNRKCKASKILHLLIVSNLKTAKRFSYTKGVSF